MRCNAAVYIQYGFAALTCFCLLATNFYFFEIGGVWGPPRPSRGHRTNLHRGLSTPSESWFYINFKTRKSMFSYASLWYISTKTTLAHMWLMHLSKHTQSSTQTHIQTRAYLRVLSRQQHGTSGVSWRWKHAAYLLNAAACNWTHARMLVFVCMCLLHRSMTWPKLWTSWIGTRFG